MGKAIKDVTKDDLIKEGGWTILSLLRDKACTGEIDEKPACCISRVLWQIPGAICKLLILRGSSTKST